MEPTNRTFTNAETGHTCRLYTSNDRSKHHLIYEGKNDGIVEGTEVKGFYLAAHTGATIKLNTKKQIFVDSGQFYQYKERETATHIKFICFARFTKM